MTPPLFQCTRIPALPLDEAADLADRLAVLAMSRNDREFAALAMAALYIAMRLHEIAEILATLAGVSEREAVGR